MKKILIAILGLFLLCGENTEATCQKCASDQDCYITQSPPPYNNICLTSGKFQGCCGCVSSSDCWGVNGGQVGVICKAHPSSSPQCVGGCNSTADCNFFNGGPPNTYICTNNQCVQP